MVVSLKWTPPSPRNGPYVLQLSYTAKQTPPFPEGRAESSNGSTTLAQNTSQFMVSNALPFANYSFTVYAMNVKFGLLGVRKSIAIRSQPVGKLYH